MIGGVSTDKNCNVDTDCASPETCNTGTGKCVLPCTIGTAGDDFCAHQSTCHGSGSSKTCNVATCGGEYCQTVAGCLYPVPMGCNSCQRCVPGGTVGSCASDADCINQPYASNLWVDNTDYCSSPALALFQWTYNDQESGQETQYQLEISTAYDQNDESVFQSNIICSQTTVAPLGAKNGTVNEVPIYALLASRPTGSYATSCTYINYNATYYCELKSGKENLTEKSRILVGPTIQALFNN